MTTIVGHSPQWRHFTPPAQHLESITITRGEGCYVWDADGKRYLDALAALHSVNIGYGPWPEVVDAAREQLETLPFFPNWFGFANAPAEALAARLRALAPMPAGHVFFSQSGSEAIEAAMKLARQYHRLRGEPGRLKFISRTGAYHGTTMGALSLNGAAALRGQFEPLLAGMSRVDPPYPYRCEICDGDCGRHSADAFDRAIRAEGAGSVAAVVIEPVQNSGGALVPPAGYVERVREICDEHGVLLIVDETICAFGRVGEWFGSTRYGLRPDIVTTAKGLTSSWAPLAATIASERVAEPFFADAGATFLHGSTFGGHPVSCAIALANLDIIEREGLLERVRAKAPMLRARCEALAARHPMIGEVRGDGFFIGLELVKHRATREPFTHVERAELITDHLLPTVREQGVHMKFDDRIELAALFTPPLIADEPEFALMVDALEAALDAAWAVAAERMGARA